MNVVGSFGDVANSRIGVAVGPATGGVVKIGLKFH